MLLTVFTLIALVFEEEHWWNYPGFELWKFVNLAIFVAVMLFILRRRTSEAFRARRENIKRELSRAREERDAALAKLKEVEERLAHLNTEVAAIHEQHVQEAAEERVRMAEQMIRREMKPEDDARLIKENIEEIGGAAQ